MDFFKFAEFNLDQTAYILAIGLEIVIVFECLITIHTLTKRVSSSFIVWFHIILLSLIGLHFVNLLLIQLLELSLLPEILFFLLYGPLLISKTLLIKGLPMEKVILYSGLITLVGIISNVFLPINSASSFLIMCLLISLFLTRNLASTKLKTWIRFLLIGIMILSASYYTVYLITESDLIIFKLLHSTAFIIFLYINYSFITGAKIFQKSSHKNFDVDSELVNELKRLFEDRKIYLRPSLSIQDIASELEEPSYKVSRVINSIYSKKLPELINHFRIQDARRKLENANGTFIKVESLGYDVGFNTPSSFYVAFKKETGMTPLKYKRTFE